MGNAISIFKKITKLHCGGNEIDGSIGTSHLLSPPTQAVIARRINVNPLVMPKPDRLSFDTGSPSPVLVVGSIAFDDIVTPFATGERILGGSASYASLAASYFAPVRLVGVVGHDFKERFVRRLESHGIDLEGLQRDESGPTFYWSGKYHENFNTRDTIEVQLNVFENFSPDMPDHYKGTPYVLLGNIQPSLQANVLGQLTDKTFVAADTMDLWINNERDALLELIRNIDCLFVNESESMLLSDRNNIIEAGRDLLKLGPRMVIVKWGEYGVYLFHQEGMFTLPSYPVTRIHDPTGAGDSFAGAFLGYLAAVNDTGFAALKRALAYATVTASMTVEAFSCDRLESAGSAAIEQRYKELVCMVSF